MAVEHSAHSERMSLEEYLTLVEQDSEHAYEYLYGRVYMMTCGGLDHRLQPHWPAASLPAWSPLHCLYF